MKDIGVYIHIPFCKSKCYYCDFTSFASCDNNVQEYVELLKQEIRDSREYNAQTIYIGGGTPSYIDSKYIKEILNELTYSNAEITIEVNPGTVDKQKLTDYFKIGINRLSIGLQSTSNDLLQEIGRIHKYEDFLRTYNLARKIGFKNINVDLLIGLPNQTFDILKDTINKIVKLEPEHISVYSLILEEETKLEKLVNEGKLILPDDELERKMYWYVKKFLEDAGYIHYEISNFAKRGLESKHNMDCWEQKEYIGFGLGAHSYIDNIRYCNTSDLNEYMKTDKIVNEVQSDFSKMQEYVMLGLRKIDGVDLGKFYEKFGKDIHSVFENELNKLVGLDLVVENDTNIKLSNKGIDLANIVWGEFV